MIKVEIDEGSGFCFGVVTAIHKAEEELAKGETLYCLGDIVHNSREVERLKAMGPIAQCQSVASRTWRATGDLPDRPQE
jgi:4-hydroxy-3-methylbut-2-enyl diphosphate reductase